MTEEDIKELEKCEATCRRFLAWDLLTEDTSGGMSTDLKDILRQVLGREQAVDEIFVA